VVELEAAEMVVVFLVLQEQQDVLTQVVVAEGVLVVLVKLVAQVDQESSLQKN
jgi:hypothetical protein